MQINEAMHEAVLAAPVVLRIMADKLYAVDLATETAAICDGVARDLATHLGLTSGLAAAEDGTPYTYPEAGDCVRALRQSWPVAAVLAEVCACLGVALPADLAAAAVDCEPLPGHSA